MSTELFDLGLRLRAAADQRPAPLLVHSPVIAAPHTVAVRAHTTRTHVTVTATADGHQPRTATNRAALDLLGQLGITITATSPAQIVTDTHTTRAALAQLATTAPTEGDHAGVAAHLAWTLDRADFPEGRALLHVIDACRTRWVTGTTPTAEAEPATWRSWLTVTDDTVTGILDLHQHLTHGVPLRILRHLAQDAIFTFETAQLRHADGHDWRIPETPGRAALNLRDRCDAAEMYAAALLDDPIHRLRATHTGHVVTGTLHPSTTPRARKNSRQHAELISDRTDCRLSADTLVTGWYGPPETTPQPHTATITATRMVAGKLHLSLSFPTSTILTTGTFTLREAAPNRHQIIARRRTYRALYATRASWLTTGRAPTITRREVPLDVLIAGAEPDTDERP